MKYPPFLTESSKIMLVSPSFGCSIEPYESRLKNAIMKLSDLGYIIIKGDYIFSNDGLLSTSKTECGHEIMRAYKYADLLISVGGGELETEVLPFIDFEEIASMRPKWFLGYSDNTNIGFLLTTLADTASIYGYNAPAFGMEEYHQSQFDHLALIKGEKLTFTSYPKWEIDSNARKVNPLASFDLTETTEYIYYPSDNIEIKGRLLGGCIDILSNLVGTCYDKVKEFNLKYQEDGIVFFLESCDLTPISLKRSLLQLRRAGWFSHIKGFIFGRPYLYNEKPFGLTYNEAIIDCLGDLNVPIILDSDIGHKPPSIPIINGAKVIIKTQPQFTITYELT